MLNLSENAPISIYLPAPTLLLTRTTCDGTSLINCFGADCLSNPIIVLVNGKGHTRICHFIVLQMVLPAEQV